MTNDDKNYVLSIEQYGTFHLKLKISWKEGIELARQMSEQFKDKWTYGLTGGLTNHCDNYFDLYQEGSIILKTNFTLSLWKEVNHAINNKSVEQSLVHLFQSLRKNTKNIEECDHFIFYSMNEIKMTTDQIIHILNSLNSIKEKLSNWKDFLNHSKTCLIELEGEEQTKLLLKTIQ